MSEKQAHAEHHGHHRNYVKIWAILLVLLVISVFGPFLEIRVITLITAFGVALVKAYMVAKNFMHLDIEKPIVHWMLVTALVFMVLLFSGVAPDVQKDSGRNWVKDEGFHSEAHSGAGGHGAGSHGNEHGEAQESEHGSDGH